MSNTRMYTDIPTDMINFVYKAPIVNKFKSRTSYVVKSKDDPNRPRYQLASKTDPLLRTPYGISKPFDEKQQDSDRKSLDMSIESDALLEVLKKLDEHNVNVAFENCKLWFGKDLTRQHIEFMYRPLVTLDKEGKYKPTFRTKINVNAGSNQASRFFSIDETDTAVRYVQKDSSLLTKGSRVVPVVDVASLWFSSTQFGMTLECTEIIVFPSSQREQFPFQWGDGKPAVAMDTDETADQSSQDQANQGGPAGGYVPPSEPHA